MSNACVIDANGITAPTYQEILANLKTGYQGIFGADVYLENDSMDGQLLAIYALAQNDNNNAVIQCYNDYSPTFSQGNGLSSVVKINGITRLIPTYSTCNVDLVGVSETLITNGQVSDGSNIWTLPSPITIPLSGTITVLATCTTEGAIQTTIGTITNINTPTFGWQSVNNSVAGNIGNPTETDFALRNRQSVSTAYPASSVVEAVEAGVANVVGILKYKVYENDSNITDSNGTPAKSISVVTQGGSPQDICTAIAMRKSAGCGTFGTSSYTVYLSYAPCVINYYVATIKNLGLTINITALQGYTDLDGNNLKQKMVDYIANCDIGQDVFYTSLISQAVGLTYHLTTLTSNINGGSFDTTDKVIAYNELVSLMLDNITLNVT